MAGPPVAVVNACTRDGQGGSPTAVVIDDATLTDGDRHAITRRTGTSHTAFIDTAEDYAFFANHFRLFTDADVVSLICPRPVFIEQGRKDRVAHWEMSQKAFEPVKQAYEKLGIGERAVYSIFEGEHEVRGVDAFQFFDRWLKPPPR